jgi:superfamily II DNA or RNA helicase
MYFYNPTHQVVICEECQSCIKPGHRSQERHLREKHQLRGTTLKTTLQLLDSYVLKSVTQLREYVRQLDSPCETLEYLKCFEGVYCMQEGCRYRTCHLKEMKSHQPSAHKISVSKHKTKPLWKECRLQTYFTGGGLIDYFLVFDPTLTPLPTSITTTNDTTPLTPAERTLFAKLEEDVKKVKGEIEEQAGIVHDFEDSRSSRVPWLEKLAFPSHLAGLKDSEIYASYKLPSPKQLQDDGMGDLALQNIIKATTSLLQDAYELCSDTSPDRKMTQQRACILNEFYTGASGKSAAFRYHKLGSSLVAYFNTWIQLVVFYYRVVYSLDGHFTTEEPSQQLPQDIIQPTESQTKAMDKVIALASREIDDRQVVDLKHALRQFFLSLICHVVGSVPFRSPILSFCAMLGRSVRMAKVLQDDDIKATGQWKEPGNYNSHLSALTWTAQLLIFDYACFQEQDNENQIPVFLNTICRKYFQQLAETPFGHILQWRLYLFQTSKQQLAKYQARWSLDKQTVGYRGTELHMTHIPALVLSEFRQAQLILHNDLLLGSDHLFQVQAWQLKDNLDLAEFGESWLTLPGNQELLQDSETALLRQIERDSKLRKLFLLTNTNGDVSFDLHAIEVYESHVQSFLTCLLVLIHIMAGQPLREPELLSITWRNTSRHRHVMIWEKLVMILTQYHKGQQQTGTYKDNIRFLPKMIGDMLLQFLAFVQPLRQIFLRQKDPKALITSYLWATLDGKVWPDGKVTQCLQRACARAKIARLHTLNWRHFSVAICKEKFSAHELTSFGSQDITADDVEDESDLASMALQSNHSVSVFNRGYAGSTGITMDTLLHRNHRASNLWQGLFRFDLLLQGKRERSDSNVLAFRMLDDVKRSQERTQATYSEADLLTVARRVHHQPDLQFRIPGQRAGILAVLGAQRVSQVVVILGTGSGKTMLITLSASLADAGTTILVLPLVALRNDLLRRFREVGIQPLIWTPLTQRTASLVIVSVELACSEQFLEYSQSLVMRQELRRVIIDECHLTITASDYRQSMTQLGWYLGKIKVQSVWLTATLPPSMQDEFIHQNKLVRPRIVRDSTNRANIKYAIRLEKKCLLQSAEKFIRTHWTSVNFDLSRDKILVYCNLVAEAYRLGELLDCPVYTSESGSWEQKAALIRDWLANSEQPVLVATTALGSGFDYPYVRWVVHIGAPWRLTEFSQNAGRAGRDGQGAASIVFLSHQWKPSQVGHPTPDHEAMELYLTQRQCFRGVLSQFLDLPQDWRWCIGGDIPCGVCLLAPNQVARPSGLHYQLQPPPETIFSASNEVLQQDFIQDRVLEQYEHDLTIMQGLCLYCRAMSRSFEHSTSSCRQKWDWIRAKQDVLRRCKEEGKEWILEYVVCWTCFQPQSICRVADPQAGEDKCRFPDMVMPLCYGMYVRPGGAAWIERHFGKSFLTVGEYLIWVGKTASLNGTECIQGNCIAAQAFSEFG